jgi:hypothetical protein
VSGTDERASGKKERHFLGTLSPDPWDLSLLMPIPVDDCVAGARLHTEPQPGLGPGVGAQVASRQSLVLRSVRLKCTRKGSFTQWTTEKRA